MKRKAFFIESQSDTFDYAICDKCGEKIKKIQDGKTFWNPNPRATDRNICRNCYDVWVHERAEKWRLWKEKSEALKNPTDINEYK